MCHCPSTDSPGSSLFCDYGFIGYYMLSHPSEPGFTCQHIAVSWPLSREATVAFVSTSMAASHPARSYYWYQLFTTYEGFRETWRDHKAAFSKNPNQIISLDQEKEYSKMRWAQGIGTRECIQNAFMTSEG